MADYLKIKEVAERLEVSPKTARKYIRNGTIPSSFIAGAYKVHRDDLERYLEEARVTPKAPSPHDRPADHAGVSSPEEWRTLAERRLLSPLAPFAVQVEVRTEYWRGLVESGRVSRDTLNYATEELGITIRGLEVLVDAAIAEGWGPAERRLLTRVYKDIRGPYHEAWTALMTTWAKGASDTQGERRLRIVADEAMERVDKAEEVLSAA